ncbi:hypothetical protein FRZ67_11900 [Panacibacter ginsenosidivorans]|uniref:CHAT domain-containing protein n=1 Tax=Panacibacter ginsenosidivorans TaxID=1813871 RepID=A0A5B8V9P1_9BACT|nr:hypothetical protein [Panacibacter ginsenosidivorans]QEC67969.1 hypothetical protein FRZ67_11900 [Panacibacter ginsenosidivorans]
MKRNFILIALLVLFYSVKAQPSADTNIPLSRLYFHEALDAAQHKLLAMDGKADSLFTVTPNNGLNNELTITITDGVDKLSAGIESDSLLDNNGKIKFLRGLTELLNGYMFGCRMDSVKYATLPDILDAYKECMPLEREGESIENNIYKYPYETGNLLLHTIAFSQNTGFERSYNMVLLKYCDKYRNKALPLLSQNPLLPFTDSLVAQIAKRDPESLYTYAAASNLLASKIRNNPDSLVRIISRMAQLKSGRQLFPFLDNLYRGKLSFENVSAVMDDDVKYYKLLVQTAIDYADMVRRRDTPMAAQSLRIKIQKKAADPFINTINGLHDVNDERVRFKILEPFTPEELYYMAVEGEEIIYTSSYVKGVYPRIWQRMKSPKSDSLLMSVRFDHFKKWIKIASNYNTLDDFLKRMDNNNAQLLMKAFVNNLHNTESLEDAVDVANSYASINDPAVRNLILNQVQWNIQQAVQTNNEKRKDIYSILNTLFLSMDSSNNINVSEVLGIPPVYFMPNKSLQDASGKIIVQQFFYGDKDGKSVFSSFLNSFSKANWKITNSEEWVTVSSTKGVPVIIYANKPLDESKSLDAKAQSDLNDYLFNKDISPTIVIHRGHSYWLPSTIDQLASSAKVVLLGSCGAYQNLDKILKICPAAQIVASKQTGSGLVNGPMISLILESVRQGKDLNWPQLWASLSKTLAKNELFDDYVPPHKNLGALFIMAYKKLQEKNAIEAGQVKK